MRHNCMSTCNII